MVGDDEAHAVEMMRLVGDVFRANLGAHSLRIEGGSMVLIVGAKYASAWIPPVGNVHLQARAIARELEDGLTS